MEKEAWANTTIELEAWIAERMQEIGTNKAVIGISGGKDSTVVAQLMVRVLGAENVYGIIMPDGEQADIEYAYDICKHLGIHYQMLDINGVTSAFQELIVAASGAFQFEEQDQTRLNLPPRVRMTLLYAVAQSLDAAVINTSNLSEDWIGYATIYGDTAGAFSPLGMFTSEEVVTLGRYLGIPNHLIEKKPSDGLTGKTDEDVFGFTYAVLNHYIRTGEIEDEAVKKSIDHKNKVSRFKFKTIPMFDPKLPIALEDEAGFYTT